jgi:hypothetical protein
MATNGAACQQHMVDECCITCDGLISIQQFALWWCAGGTCTSSVLLPSTLRMQLALPIVAACSSLVTSINTNGIACIESNSAHVVYRPARQTIVSRWQHPSDHLITATVIIHCPQCSLSLRDINQYKWYCLH